MVFYHPKVIKTTTFKNTQLILHLVAYNQDLIKKIKMFGLNSYEAKIWSALLGRNISTAGELSDIANVPRSRSYDVLESLEKKGFVIMKLGKPIKYLAVPPKEVLERVKKQIETNTEKHISEIKSGGFSNLIKGFQELYEKNTKHTENIIAILRGRKNINRHIFFLFKEAKKDAPILLENTEKDLDALANTTKNKTKHTKAHPGLRIYVVGDNALLFPINEEEAHPDYDLCVWIRNKHTSKFIEQLLIAG